MKHMKAKKIAAIVLLVAVSIILGTSIALAQSDASQGGLVPLTCQGGAGQPCACNLCDAYELGKRIINFLLYAVSIPIAALAFLYGGLRMLTSQGNPTAITEGKAAITNAVIGLALAFFAWIILSTILTTLGYGITGVTAGNIFSPLACHPGGTGCNLEFPAVPPPTDEGGPPPGTQTFNDQETRDLLELNGIEINKSNCTNPGQTDCTSLDGLNSNTIGGLIRANDFCKAQQIGAASDVSCIVVTGGTEAGHDSHGVDHPNTVDLRWDSFNGPRTIQGLNSLEGMHESGAFGNGYTCERPAGNAVPCNSGSIDHIHVEF